MKEINHIKEISEEDIGKWLKVEGFGVLDGLSYVPLRNDLYKILEIKKDEITLKKYRKRNESVLPEYNWNQRARIYNQNDFQKLYFH